MRQPGGTRLTEPAPHRRRGLFFLGLSVAAVGFAINMHVGLASNYAVDVMKITGLQQGILETCRESCGILAVGVLAVLAGLAEPLVGSLVLVLMGLGLASYVMVPSYGWLIVASVVWSQGFHVWVPLPNSMALAMAEPGRAGARLGQIQTAGAAGSGAGLLVALLLSLSGMKLRPLYLLAGGAALLAAAACGGIPRDIKTPGPRLVFRRRYWLYYLLNFLEGWRKQVVLAFASFLLVQKHHTPVRTMLALWIAIQAIGYVASPRAGRLIDRVGERRVLVFYYCCLTLFFLAYATVPSPLMLYVIFVIDGSFFVFSMALTTLVSRLAPAGEHTATLSMGVAVNHVAAVTMPLVGGLLWKYAGYHWVFILGAAAAALSILGALRIPRHSPAPAPQAHA